jgi:hypothetical protein
MSGFFGKHKTFFFIVLMFFFAASPVLAGNPVTPILPSDNIQDPGSGSTAWGGCGPTDSNCYVTITASQWITSGSNVYYNTGNVGIGDATPAALLTVGSGDLFQVNSSGAIAAAAGITSSGTITITSLGGGGTQCLQVNNSGVLSGSGATCGGGGGGTVTSISIASANGFTGSSSGGSTPILTLTTSVNGLVKGNGTGLSAATSGTDYAPGTSGLTTGILKSTTGTGVLSIAVAADFPTLNQNTTGSAATLTTARSIYGNSFNGSADLSQIITSAFGGTGNGFTKFSGPATSEKTFTLPNASATILTTNALVTVGQGGTGAGSFTSNGVLYGNGTGAIQVVAPNAGATLCLTQASSGIPAWASCSSGGGGVTTLAAIGSSPNANGATISGTTLNLEPASASFGGVVTTGTQTFAGAKTFNSDLTINTLTVGLGNSGVSTNTAVGYNSLIFNTTGYENTALGFFSLRSNLGGGDNTAIGFQSLFANTAGLQNSALGAYALNVNTTGNFNTAVGHAALGASTTGDDNTAQGAYALASNVSGQNNTAVGEEALRNNGKVVTAGSFIAGVDYTIQTTGTTNFVAIGAANNNPGTVFTATGAGSGTGTASSNTSSNVGIGYQALTSNITGGQNVAVGNLALGANINGVQSVGIGNGAAGSNVLSNSLIAIGFQALANTGKTVSAGSFVSGAHYVIQTTGTTNFVAIGAANNNPGTGFFASGPGTGTGTAAATTDGSVGIGYQAAANNITGYNNVSIGAQSLVTNTSGSQNVSVGGSSLISNLIGSNNSGFGSYALYNSTGDNNIGIGYSAGDALTAGSNNIFIGAGVEPNISNTGSNQLNIGNWIYGDNGNIGIGDSTPLAKLDVFSSATGSVIPLQISSNPGGSSAVNYNQLYLNNTHGAGNFKNQIGFSSNGTELYDIGNDINGDGSQNFFIWDEFNAEPRLFIDNDGRVGIGTTSLRSHATGPIDAKMEIRNNGTDVSPQLVLSNANTSNYAQLMLATDNGHNWSFGAANSTESFFGIPDDFFIYNSNDDLIRMVIKDGTGNVGVGDTNPGYRLAVQNTAIDGNILSLKDSDGTCLHNPEAGSEIVSCSSDARLKTNIVDTTSALSYFSDFQIRDYNIIASGDKTTGVIAQELLLTHPELVSQDGSGMYSVQLPNQWKVIKAIQELNLQTKSITELTESDDTSFVAHLRAWLANATNHITRIFTGEICLTDTDGTSECLNKTELHGLKQLLNTQSQPVVTPTPDPTPTPEPTPPNQAPDTPPVDNTVTP